MTAAAGRYLVVTLHRPDDQFYEVFRRLLPAYEPGRRGASTSSQGGGRSAFPSCAATTSWRSSTRTRSRRCIRRRSRTRSGSRRAVAALARRCSSQPGALSRTTKSRELPALAAAGVTVARGRRLAHWREGLNGAGVGFPLFLRYDSDHSPGGSGLAGPFYSAEELERALLAEGGRWAAIRDFEGGLAAVPWIDTGAAEDGGSSDVTARSCSGPSWFAATSSSSAVASPPGARTAHLPEMRRFIHGQLTAAERALFLRVSRILQLPFCDRLRPRTGRLDRGVGGQSASDRAGALGVGRVHLRRFAQAMTQMLLPDKNGVSATCALP